MSIPKVIIVLLAFAIYSSSVVFVRRRLGREECTEATPVEGLMVLAGVIALAVLGPSRSSMLQMGIVMLGSGLVGTVIGIILARASGAGGIREFEEYGARKNSVWKRWTSFGRSVADHEVRLILVVSYFILVMPLAVAFRRKTKDSSPLSSGWNIRSNVDDTLDAARRSF
jgi:hypothetical protein